MATKFYILPYTQHSAGAIKLADELDGKRVKLVNSTYSYNPDHVLINWGNGDCKYPQALNSKIMDVINKVSFFKRLHGTTYIPPYATTKTAAANLSFPVVCRTSVEGHDGQGIVIADTASQLVMSSLYTQYIDKTSEYRIHVGRNKSGEIVIISRQKKYLTDDFKGDKRVWTGDETKLSFIEWAPIPVITLAKNVMKEFPELTFGALDIVYDNSTERAYVLEINSAPMMTTETTRDYAAFFRGFLPAGTVTAPPASAEAVVDTSPTPTAAPAPTSTGGFNLKDFVKAQVKAGHISKTTLEQAWTPAKPTEEQLIENYVTILSK